MIDHLSYSQISMYLRCGESWRRRYVEKEIMPPGIALIKGKSCHKGIEENGRQKIETRQDMKKSDIIDIAVADYDAIITGNDIMLMDDEKGIGKDTIIGKGKDSLVTVAGLYADEAAPLIQPAYVEHRVDLDIAGVKVTTIIDAIAENMEIHDYKVTGKVKTDNDAASSLQLSLYAQSLFAIDDRCKIAMVGFDCLVDKKVPEYRRVVSTRRPEEIFKISSIVHSVKSGIEAGIFLPAAEGAWVCSERFCGYYKTCKYVGNRIF